MEQLILDRKFYHVSKSEMVFNMMNVIYMALRMCAFTEKTTFLCKDKCTLTNHTRRWTFSALRYAFLPKKVNGEKLDELLCDQKFKVVETGIVDIKIYLTVSLFSTLHEL